MDNELIKKIKRSKNRIHNMLKDNKDKTIIFAFSGGKDSTLTLHFLLEILSKSRNNNFSKNIYVVFSNTGVEIPVYERYVYEFLDKLKNWINHENIPLKVVEVKPVPEKTFWYCLFVRGYPMPTYSFRWCTRVLKTEPMRNFIKNHTPAVVVLGVRESESSTRKKTIKKRKTSKLWSSYDGVPNAKAFMPIVDWDENEVFECLENSTTPWGESYKELLNLYKLASSNKGIARFGCWICSVVKRDKTLQCLYNNGYTLAKELDKFKWYLYDESRKPKNRIKLKNGRYSKIKPNVRRKLFGEFIIFNNTIIERYGVSLISDEEVKYIKKNMDKLE